MIAATLPGDRTPAAGLRVRSLAFAWDYLPIAVYLTLVVVAGAAIQWMAPSTSNALFGNPLVGQIVGFLLITLPVTLYFALSDSSAARATWGKRRMRLQVVDLRGRQLSRARSFARTLLKFVPWELAHTCIWQVSFSAEPSAPVFTIGFVSVWLLVGVNVASALVSRDAQTLYDKLTGTRVEHLGATGSSAASLPRIKRRNPPPDVSDPGL